MSSLVCQQIHNIGQLVRWQPYWSTQGPAFLERKFGHIKIQEMGVMTQIHMKGATGISEEAKPDSNANLEIIACDSKS